jgi:RNA polymerase sigma-70 factor, ECF subfamily
MPDKRRRFELMASALLPQLYRYAYWLGRDRALAEDVVQEALLRAWKSFDSLTDPDKAKSWLLTIVRREHARTFEGLRPIFTDVDEMKLADTEYSPVEAQADAADMRRLIGRLEPDYREPLVLQVVMGCSCQEIADLMDLSRAAVLTRLFRARKKLSEMVAAPDVDARRGVH